MQPSTDIKNLTLAQFAAFLGGLGLPAARARQVFALVHRPGCRGFLEMKSVNRQVREQLAAHAHVSSLRTAKVQKSRDGTVKTTFRLEDGVVIESVLIPAGDRHTLCVSSQAGCAMGCRFCLTAGMGFLRNLTAAEIVNQVSAAQEHLIEAGVERATPRQLIDNIVFMGMGEPLANYENLITALAILMGEQGLGYSQRQVTVSTCGLPRRIADLGRDARVNLAVSLHAAADAARTSLMPANRAHGVGEVLAACRAYPLSKRQVVFVEYLLIRGVNDSVDDARALAGVLRGLRCRVNLLPYNESPALPYRGSPPESVAAFQQVLRSFGYRTLIRNSRGSDIAAACGQLAAGGAEAAARP